MSVGHIGKRLTALGWEQGCLLPADKVGFHLYVAAEPAEGEAASTWKPHAVAMEPGDMLVVVSQTCDIDKPPSSEPYVEAMRAYWTADSAHKQKVRPNSIRRICLGRRVGEGGHEEWLIVDAAYRVLLDKASLLTILPEPAFGPGDRRGRRRFADWLGSRFDREPLPDDMVDALQRPIVNAIRNLGQLDDKNRLIDGMKEVRFNHEKNAEGALEVELLLFPEEEAGIDLEGAVVIAGWFDRVLRETGSAYLSKWDLYDMREISAYDYANSLQLPLGEFSAEE